MIAKLPQRSKLKPVFQSTDCLPHPVPDFQLEALKSLLILLYARRARVFFISY